MKLLAIEHNDNARRLLARGCLREAEQSFVKAAELAPQWSVPWANLGLLYKQQQKWHKALECNQRATQLNPGDKASWWNLGLAATAVGNWQEARRAWLIYGLAIPSGDDPPDFNLGVSAIRVDPTGTAEVVWCKRLDPARTVIKNVPSPTSRRRFGDMLLNDGLARGYRLYEGKRITIFDELAVLAPSPYATYEIVAEEVTEADRIALVVMAEKYEMGIEEWATARIYSKKQRKSQPATLADGQATEWTNRVKYGIAARGLDDINDLLAEWCAGRTGCAIQQVRCVYSAFDGVG
jgi:hypothetical protein